MVLPEQSAPSMTHPYSHAIQLKLYQAFIFSIPILFSIILFLLFYLFYLKRRAYNLSTSPPLLPTSYHHPMRPTQFIPMRCELMDMKGELKEKLPKVVVDEELRARDSVCCVCLGEFEMKEELIQVPSCKHMFHVDCIYHWLQSNSTCPLCRCSVVGPAVEGPSVILPNFQQAHINISNHLLQQVSNDIGATVLGESSSNSTAAPNGGAMTSHDNQELLAVVHMYPTSRSLGAITLGAATDPKN